MEQVRNKADGRSFAFAGERPRLIQFQALGADADPDAVVRFDATKTDAKVELPTVPRLTPVRRAAAIVDPQRSEKLARAFQNVPLLKVIFEDYNGGVLPPAAALEREMVGLGVAEKQTSKARQVFERPAEQAGYFEHGKTRLVMPAREEVLPVPLQDEVRQDRDSGSKGSGNPHRRRGCIRLFRAGCGPYRRLKRNRKRVRV